MTNAPRPASRPGRRELAVSLGMLALMSVLVVTALALQGNRPKALRVGLAAAIYLSGLLLWRLSRRTVRDDPVLVPPAPFLLSGCGAGLASGLVRSDPSVAVVLVQVAGAGLLLGGFHWLAIRTWRRVYERIAGRAKAPGGDRG